MADPVSPSSSLGDSGSSVLVRRRPGRAAPLWQRTAWGLLLVVGLGYFLMRGPIRAFSPGGNNDFRFLHNALRTFQGGQDPYNSADVRAVAEEHGLLAEIHPYLNTSLLYAPGFLSVFYPVGLLDTNTAVWLWFVMQLAAVVALGFYAGQLAALSGEDRLRFTALMLFFTPIHTNIAHGQPSIVFCALAVFLFWNVRQRRDLAGGVALGLLMIKPSFGVPGALVSLVAGRHRVLVIGAVVSALTWLPMIQRYGIEGTVSRYHRAITDVQRPGHDADDSRENPHRYDLINLRSWLYSWSLHRALTEIAYFVLVGLMVWALWKFRWRIRDPGGGQLYWSLAAAFLCLALYHRFYDASLMIVAVAALLARWKAHPWQVLGLGVPLVLFAVPGTAMLRAHWGGLEEASSWVEALIIRHQAFALVILALAAGGILYREAATSRGVSEVSSD